MKINYSFPRLTQVEREYLEMVLLEEMEMQNWFAVSYSKSLDGELLLMLQ